MTERRKSCEDHIKRTDSLEKRMNGNGVKGLIERVGILEAQFSILLGLNVAIFLSVVTVGIKVFFGGK